MKIIFTAIFACILTFNASAEERVFLGAETKSASKEVQAQLGITKDAGHTVVDVIKDSPAEKSGLKKNDVIISVDSKNVKNFIKLGDYISAIYEKGNEITIEYFRQGKKETVKATLGVRDITESSGGLDLFDSQQKATQNILKQLQNGGLGNLIANGGPGVSTMLVDGEHRIAVSGKGKGKHVKVINTNSNKVEYEGDIIDNDFSDVPSDLRPKVERAITMLGNFKMGNFGGNQAPKAEDDSAEKVDDFIKEIEKKESTKEKSEDK